MADEHAFLVIDDDVTTRRILERMIHMVFAAAQVTGVGLVTEAREMLQHECLTSIITDYHLPDGTALDVLATARTLDRPCNIVVTSGSDAVQEAALDAGATVFLHKPIDFKHLMTIIRTLHP